ncbi:MAG TPA: HAD-IIB family hydrolase [Pirellulales bacterium]|nr:HAD-IIB family hydrolase [Pirellulales bacterium]
MPRFRLLALDIDGTLVNSRDELTPATCAAIHRACQAGIRVVLATGRRYSKALHLVEPLKIDVPLISASGALIKDPLDHRTLFRAAFPPGVLEAVLPIVAAACHDAVLYADTFLQGFDFYCQRLLLPPGEQTDLAEYFARNVGCGRLWPNLMTAPPPGVFAGFAMASRPAMTALGQTLTQRFGNQLYVHILKSPFYSGWFCEIEPGGVSKWSAVQHLARDWGISDDEICAVGDDVNDIPMVRGAGLGVAMGNAVAELKAAADRVAPCHDSDGLVEVVRRLLQ